MQKLHNKNKTETAAKNIIKNFVCLNYSSLTVLINILKFVNNSKSVADFIYFFNHICKNINIIYQLTSVEGGSSLKWCLPCQGNITAVFFPKWLELGVTSYTHSALTSFGIRLACGSSLKSQKPCWSFSTHLDFLSELAQGLLA